jgi:hypothetical protein
MTPQRSTKSDSLAERPQEEQDVTDKFNRDEAGSRPSTIVPSDPVPDRPGDPKPAEIAGTGNGVSTGGVEREQEPHSQSDL